MVMALQKGVYADWRGGQNSRLAPYLLNPRELTLARNLWYDARGQLEKRPGYTKLCGAELSPPAARITGAEVYEQEAVNGTTSDVIFWRNGRAYREQDCGLTVPSICSGYSATAFMRMVNAKNKLLGVNGSASFLLTGATVFTSLGLTAPTSAPTTAVGAAGVLTGDFLYKVTYEYGTGDRGESNASAASASVTLAAQKGELSAIPIGPTGVTKRHIYRTTAGGATYYFLVTLADNTTEVYSDNNADATLGDELETDNDAPPEAQYLAWWKNMAFYAGNSSARRRLYFSKIGNPEQVPATTHFIDVPVAGDEITGLAALDEALLVFTHKSVFALTGASVETFSFRIVDAQVGCTAPKSIAVHMGYGYFMHHDRYYRSSGGPAQHVSDNIEPSWIPGLRANLKDAVATVWQNRLLVYVFLGTTATASKNGAADDTAANNKVFGLDLTLRDQAEDGRESAWFEWTNIFPNCWVVKRGPAVTQELLYWGTNRSTGLMYKMSDGGASGAFADDGAAIAWRMETRDLSEGDPELVKKWRQLEVIAKGASGQTLTPYIQLDQAGGWTALPAGAKSLAATRGGLVTERWGLAGQSTGHYARFALEESSTSYFLLHAIATYWRPVRGLHGA